MTSIKARSRNAVHCSVTARHHERVDVAPHRADAAVGVQGQAARRHHRAVGAGGNRDLVVVAAGDPVGRPEHLDGTDHVERLNRRVGDDDHAARRHEAILLTEPPGGNDENPSIPARTPNRARQFSRRV